ncbi:hypothetical protein Q2T83_03595 [Fervidibacter sacchari]|uniref:DUF304 domain-containing protein n=1 Tax=Candidatus Fervidibacter sacchari TaxID=1448929 RepID=A0ABT2EPF6_9BACT|nr:hypothetical protein [Candidatus Fervidibacter sacchari]MCS3919848.1 hypothetical protein [Candidatus Fervidibacter sacchari]WKU16913.1 hypothetical protein Q2T83_03595 [Candidatus Fervidibacter sacchari]
MAFVEPSKGRAKIIDLGDTLRIEIPMRSKNFVGLVVVLIFPLFLTGWFIGRAVEGISTLRELNLLSRSEGWTPQVLPLVGGLIVQGVFILALLGYIWLCLLQRLVGREIITVSPVSLDIVSRPIGRLRRYRLTEISNLRVLEKGSGSIISFDYGASMVRFGLNLDPAEAQQIVALLKERFGQYMADSKAGGMEDGVC